MASAASVATATPRLASRHRARAPSRAIRRAAAIAASTNASDADVAPSARRDDPTVSREDRAHVVLGAGGRTGTEIVKRLVRNGANVRACTRSGAFDAAAATSAPWSSTLVTRCACDVAAGAAGVAAAVAGADVVYFAATASASGDPDAVDRDGVVDVARACVENDVRRLVLVSGAGVTKREAPAYGFLNAFGGRMDAKAAGEDGLRAVYQSTAAVERGCTYTIVRPSGLLDGDAKGAASLAVNQGDEVAGFITRADAAAACVEAAESANCANRTFEVYERGTAVATATLSIADILSDRTLAKVVAFAEGVFRRRGGGEGDGVAAEVLTAREVTSETWEGLFRGLTRDA